MVDYNECPRENKACLKKECLYYDYGDCGLKTCDCCRYYNSNTGNCDMVCSYTSREGFCYDGDFYNPFPD